MSKEEAQDDMVLQSLTQKESNFASEKAKLSCLAGWLSFALPQAKLLFFCVKDCKCALLIYTYS